MREEEEETRKKKHCIPCSRAVAYRRDDKKQIKLLTLTRLIDKAAALSALARCVRQTTSATIYSGKDSRLVGMRLEKK